MQAIVVGLIALSLIHITPRTPKPDNAPHKVRCAARRLPSPTNAPPGGENGCSSMVVSLLTIKPCSGLKRFAAFPYPRPRRPRQSARHFRETMFGIVCASDELSLEQRLRLCSVPQPPCGKES